MKPRKPRIRDLPPKEQANRWWECSYIKNSVLTDAGLLAVLSYYKGVDPQYLPGLLKEARERGTPRLKALLVSLALQGKLQL